MTVRKWPDASLQWLTRHLAGRKDRFVVLTEFIERNRTWIAEKLVVDRQDAMGYVECHLESHGIVRIKNQDLVTALTGKRSVLPA